MGETLEQPGRTLIVRLGQKHNKFYTSIPNYKGPLHIGPELLKAIDDRLRERTAQLYRRLTPNDPAIPTNWWKHFDHIEIVGEE